MYSKSNNSCVKDSEIKRFASAVASALINSAWASASAAIRFCSASAWTKAICFSFSNNCNTYIYGPKIEPYKRAYHYAIIFDDFGPFNELFDDETTEKIKKSVEGITDLKDRRIKFSHALGDYILSLEKCGSIENKEKLDTVKYTVDIHPTYIGHVNQHLQYKERFDLLKHTINMYGTPRNMCPTLE